MRVVAYIEARVPDNWKTSESLTDRDLVYLIDILTPTTIIVDHPKYAGVIRDKLLRISQAAKDRQEVQP